MAYEQIMQFLKHEWLFQCSYRCRDFSKITAQSIENVQGEIIICNGMIDEGDFVSKSFDRVQVFMNYLIPSLNHCEFLLQLHGPSMRFSRMHGMQFLPCLLGCLCSRNEWGDYGGSGCQNGTKDKFILSYLVGFLWICSGGITRRRRRIVTCDIIK